MGGDFHIMTEKPFYVPVVHKVCKLLTCIWVLLIFTTNFLQSFLYTSGKKRPIHNILVAAKSHLMWFTEDTYLIYEANPLVPKCRSCTCKCLVYLLMPH